ncbi:MAG TPA: prolipoprotein diacylglyceryl transferase [Acidobacteria bacterium]|nr:prolipoprotein diacylglyceryl transferase [Acidobacteriota bacterium]
MPFPHIDPIAFSIGPLHVRWYGLMYLAGFIAGWALGRFRARRPGSRWSGDDVDRLVVYGAFGVLLGGRIGYVVFYNFPTYVAHPLEILAIWQGGMSFHGGLLGVLAAVWLFARRTGRSFFQVTDFLAPLVPIGLGAGRIGNFINGELWGKASNLPWAVVFSDPRAGGVPRHPTELYEALLEGVVLFVILWIFSSRPRPRMAVSGLFLLCYGVFRFAVEFVRLPDPQLGYLAFGWLTMGQVLTAPMILAGAGLLWLAYRQPERSADS